MAVEDRRRHESHQHQPGQHHRDQRPQAPEPPQDQHEDGEHPRHHPQRGPAVRVGVEVEVRGRFVAHDDPVAGRRVGHVAALFEVELRQSHRRVGIRAGRRHEDDRAAVLRVVGRGIRARSLADRLDLRRDPLGGETHLARPLGDCFPAGSVGPERDDAHHRRCQRPGQQHQHRAQAPVTTPAGGDGASLRMRRGFVGQGHRPSSRRGSLHRGPVRCERPRPSAI